MTTRAILTYNTSDGRKEIRFFKTVNEAKQMIETLRSCGAGKYFDFKIKIVKPLDKPVKE